METASSKRLAWVRDRNSLLHEVKERACEVGFGGFPVMVGGKRVLVVVVESGG